jgi:putative transposase
MYYLLAICHSELKKFGLDKVDIIVEILREANTISEIGAREKVSPKQLYNWKREFLENANRAFSVTKDEKAAREMVKSTQEREQELLAKIGQLTYECDWLKKKYRSYVPGSKE